MAILSIQSHVAYGHVGNSAAVFPLQRAGHEVWPVHTVNFSNHTEYPEWGGPVLSTQDIDSIIAGLERRGAFPRVRAVLTGYLGTPALAHVVVDTVARVKAANPGALFACDPVIGNAIFGSFVAPEIPAVFRELVIPQADVITPNQWEVALLSGRPCETLAQTIDAARSLCSTVLVTSVDLGPDSIGMLALDADHAFLVQTPRVPGSELAGGKVVGAGDITAALFTGNLLAGQPLDLALELTASAVYGVIAATRAAGEDELQLVANQELFASPRRAFRARAL